MQVTVFGAGYVGLVSGACLADEDHDVVCVDIDEENIEKLRTGESPIYEPSLERCIAEDRDSRTRCS